MLDLHLRGRSQILQREGHGESCRRSHLRRCRACGQQLCIAAEAVVAPVRTRGEARLGEALKHAS
jgi:hypothetical protein